MTMNDNEAAATQKLALEYLRAVWHWGDSAFTKPQGAQDTEGVRSMRYLGLLIHRMTRAAIAEFDGGCNYGVPVLMRACLEALINLSFIASDATRFQKRGAAFLLAQDRVRLTGINQLIGLFDRNNAAALSQHTTLANLQQQRIDTQASIAAYEVEQGITKHDWPSALDQRAQPAGKDIHELYVNLYWTLSNNVHAMPVSLTTRSAMTGGMLVIDSSPAPGEVEAQLGTLIDFYLRMLEHLKEKVGFPALPPELQESLA